MANYFSVLTYDLASANQVDYNNIDGKLENSLQFSKCCNVHCCAENHFVKYNLNESEDLITNYIANLQDSISRDLSNMKVSRLVVSVFKIDGDNIRTLTSRESGQNFEIRERQGSGLEDLSLTTITIGDLLDTNNLNFNYYVLLSVDKHGQQSDGELLTQLGYVNCSNCNCFCQTTHHFIGISNLDSIDTVVDAVNLQLSTARLNSNRIFVVIVRNESDNVRFLTSNTSENIQRVPINSLLRLNGTTTRLLRERTIEEVMVRR